MVKPDGNMRDHYRYDEYGKPAPGNTKLSEDGRINLNNTFGYTGEMWDEETNLLYLRARYYEPETGRFLSRDTYEGNLENPLSRHLYAYVGNNPVNYSDPTGHEPPGLVYNKGKSNTNPDDKANINSISKFKEKYGGYIKELAKGIVVDPDYLAAIIIVESSGSGFEDGRMKIRFEAHYFNRLTKKKYSHYFSYNHPNVWENQKYRTSLKREWNFIHTNQNSNYAAFDFAKGLNSEAAYESISMGMGQIMGEYYATAGYKSAKEMFDDFSKGNKNQIRGMVNFIKGKGLVKALQKKDFNSFINGYNGPGKVGDYKRKFEKALKEYKKCK